MSAVSVLLIQPGMAEPNRLEGSVGDHQTVAANAPVDPGIELIRATSIVGVEQRQLQVPFIERLHLRSPPNHKINTGPFVQTPFGPRLLRPSQIERMHGCDLNARHYSTTVMLPEDY